MVDTYWSNTIFSIKHNNDFYVLDVRVIVMNERKKNKLRLESLWFLGVALMYLVLNIIIGGKNVFMIVMSMFCFIISFINFLRVRL